MKKIKQKGFTLIELLAVITIMGILLLVAIPAVSRIIDNSRRDTFATVAKEYLNAVRTAYTADTIECWTNDTDKWKLASSLPAGSYHFPICTSTSKCAGYSKSFNTTSIVQNTKDLMESGGKSPYGNAELQGFVEITKEVDEKDPTKTKVSYSIHLGDTGGHGLDNASQDEIKRSAIKTSGVSLSNRGSSANPCRMA